MKADGQQTTVQRAASPQKSAGGGTVKDYLLKAEKSIAMALPRHVNPDRFIRVALVSINQNPKLLECTKESLLSCVMSSAQLGLEPGPLGHVYLIPYKDSKRNVSIAQFQLGYKGIIELIQRTGQVEVINAVAVHEKDHFEFELGFDEKLVIRPAEGDRGKVVRYVAYAKTKAGGRYQVVMSRDEVEKHAKKFSKAYASGYDTPWKSDFDEMAKKTVLIKLAKFLPKSIELTEAIKSNPEIRTDLSGADDITGLGEVIDMPTTSNQTGPSKDQFEADLAAEQAALAGDGGQS